ncbi:MAG: 50S ribosomal protein L18 [Candidatus Tectomicrobia bacterium]|nr:50S ribosomal protein L18 [Candidatus Tectomicrobia bacterium]
MLSLRARGRQFRKQRVRRKVSGTPARPRLSVFKSNKHIYAQLIDDHRGVTLAACTSTAKALKPTDGKTATVAMAKVIGEKIAEAALAQGITSVVFDRNGYRYHGKIAALADAAREKGLRF